MQIRLIRDRARWFRVEMRAKNRAPPSVLGVTVYAVPPCRGEIAVGCLQRRGVGKCFWEDVQSPVPLPDVRRSPAAVCADSAATGERE